MLPSVFVTTIDAAIERAQRHLLAHQQPDGHWVGEVEADATITSEYLLFSHLIDRRQRDREVGMVRYLRRRQLPDGGFGLYEGGPANLSATIKAYFALKMAGVGVDDPTELLGLYHGTPLTERSIEEGFSMPDRIVLYQRNIEDMCETKDEVIEEIRTTVLHEIGHHFGLDEDDLEELGYD